MTTTAHASRLVVVAAAALMTLSPSAAFAGTTAFADPAETPNPDDIVGVTVQHAPRMLTIRVQQQQMRRKRTDLPIHATIAISTGPQFNGPEYLIQQPFYTEGGPNLRRTQGWDGPRGPLKNCKADLSWNNATDVIRFSVPRRCIGRPQEVRVNVKYRFFEPVGARTVDYAPAKRVLGPCTGI